MACQGGWGGLFLYQQSGRGRGGSGGAAGRGLNDEKILGDAPKGGPVGGGAAGGGAFFLFPGTFFFHAWEEENLSLSPFCLPTIATPCSCFKTAFLFYML